MRLVSETANFVIERHGGTPLAYEAIGAISGQPLERIFRLVWPGMSDADVLAYRDEYRARYDQIAIPATRLYRGAKATLRAFRRAGILQATVTGKRARDCERILRGLGIENEVDAYLGGDLVPHPKPAPDLALAALERLDVDPTDAAVIGDTRSDMLMGRDAGTRTIQVLWGYESEPLAEADAVARTWRELRALVLDGPPGAAG